MTSPSAGMMAGHGGARAATGASRGGDEDVPPSGAVCGPVMTSPREPARAGAATAPNANAARSGPATGGTALPVLVGHDLRHAALQRQSAAALGPANPATAYHDELAQRS